MTVSPSYPVTEQPQLGPELVLQQARELQKFYENHAPPKPYTAGVLADCIHTIERLDVAYQQMNDAFIKASNDAAQPPIISVKPMALSDDRTDYFVSIKVGDREITPYVFRDEQFKAEYEAASFRWLLLGDAKPDLMAYSEDGWPDNAEVSPSLASTGRGTEA